MQDDLGKLLSLVEPFRVAIESCREQLPIGLKNFPNGACNDASILLLKYLTEQGITGFVIYKGQRGGANASHAWLQKGDIFVDLTAGQFKDSPSAVIVAKQSEWHTQFMGRACPNDEPEIYDEGKPCLESAYKIVLAVINSEGV